MGCGFKMDWWALADRQAVGLAKVSHMAIGQQE
ncbi:MAG: hypothetical protein RIS47_599, partial [Bacteroidota bacterium]